MFFPGNWRIAAGEWKDPPGIYTGVPVEAGDSPANSGGARGIRRGVRRALWRSRVAGELPGALIAGDGYPPLR